MTRNSAIALTAVLVVGLTAAACTPESAGDATLAGKAERMESPGGGYTTVVGSLSDSIVHLATGDSIEWQSAGPAQVAGQPEGLLVTYHPYFELADTARVRRTAVAFFNALRPKLVDREPPFVVLRAVSLRSAERNGPTPLRAYGVVLERRVDGQWYRLGDSTALRP